MFPSRQYLNHLKGEGESLMMTAGIAPSLAEELEDELAIETVGWSCFGVLPLNAKFDDEELEDEEMEEDDFDDEDFDDEDLDDEDFDDDDFEDDDFDDEDDDF
jgi:hypothetical protein